MFGHCLADAVPASWDWSQFDWDCYPLAWETAPDTRPEDIATYWKVINILVHNRYIEG